MLLGIIDDPALVGHIVTKAAKALYLIPEDKAKLKGNTIREWLNSFEVDGRNTPNAWACQAAMTVLIQWGKALEFTNRESYLTAVYYLNPSNDKKVLLASKEIIDKLL